MIKGLPVLIVGAVLLFTAGCTQEGRGLVLPEGNIEKGKSTFVELSCNHCHNVGVIEWIGSKEHGDVHVSLGGDVQTKMTYGKLVTSIINPSHKISKRYKEETATPEGKSKMENYNQIMTVAELVDLVTYLQTEYKIVPPQNTYYFN